MDSIDCRFFNHVIRIKMKELIVTKILLYLFFLQLVFGIQVEYVEAYFNSSNFLNRPRMNKSNEFISAEIYTFTADAVYRDWNDGIVLFKKFSDDLNVILNEGYKITRSNNRCYAGGALWSNEREDWILFEEKNPEKKQVEYQERPIYGEDISFAGKIFHDTDNQSFSLNVTAIRDHESLRFYYGINDTDTYNLYSMKMVKFDEPPNYNFNSFPIKNEIIFYLYKDYNDQIILKSNHPDYKSSNQVVKLFDIPAINFDMVQQYDGDRIESRSFNLLYEVNDRVNQNTVYFSCYTSTNPYHTEIPLYPMAKDMPQKDALFNRKGNKIAFLNYEINQRGYLPDLYVVDISECKDCSQFSEDYNNELLELDYQKIDDNIINQEFWEDDSPIFTSYCWHPYKNILFYVKRIQTVDKSNQYPIYYYDLDSNEGPIKMDILTNYNKDLSVSKDGSYLLFSFSGLMYGASDEVIHKTYFRNSNDSNIYKQTTRAVGLAKLIYD